MIVNASSFQIRRPNLCLWSPRGKDNLTLGNLTLFPSGLDCPGGIKADTGGAFTHAISGEQ